MNNIYSVFIICIWIFIILLSAISSKKFFPSNPELSRKIVHIGTGPVVPMAWSLNIPKEIAVPISGIITLALLVNNQIRFIETFEGVNRKSYGTIAYGLSITILLFLLWPKHADAVSAGILIMAFGDGLAGLIGPKLKSPAWKIFGQRKSLAGTVTMGLISIIVLTAIMMINGNNIQPVLLITIPILAVGLEQIGPWGIDNLTVPIGVAYWYSWLSN